MYSDAKLRIAYNNKKSDLFACENAPFTVLNLFERFARIFRRVKYKKN